MNCGEATEFVSALCDGERIPTVAAEHIGRCESCGERLRAYVAMGAELRRIASMETGAAAPQRTWKRGQHRLVLWWQKGWEGMRIPRIAFAVLIAGIIVLASTLAVVKVRARDAGTVVLLTVAAGNERSECPLSTVDKGGDSCGFVGKVEQNTLGYGIELLKRDGDKVQLGIRSVVLPATASLWSNDLTSEPQRQFWFQPGDTLKVDLPGLSPLIIKGNWLDHKPAFAGTHDMDPGPDELRFISPLLLRGKEVIGDMGGASSIVDKRNLAAWIYYPKQGSYFISLVPTKGGIKARVQLNRILFEEGGNPYVFITGAPITRSRYVWVLHQQGFDPDNLSGGDEHEFTTVTEITETPSGEWVPAPTAK